MIWLIVAAAIVPRPAGQASTLSANRSLYTSVRPADCRAPPRTLIEEFKAQGVTGQQCPAMAGWRVFVVASDANSWLELRSSSVNWSSEAAVVYESPIGQFPSVGGSRTIEWRRLPNGKPTALIFRVSAQDADNTAKRVSRLFVARLEPARACLIGRVATNDEARTLADGPEGCAEPTKR